MSVLGGQYVAELLLFLLDHGEAHTVELKEISSYYQGVMREAQELALIGLVDIEESADPYRKRTFMLTEEGIEIAEILKEAEDYIQKNKVESM
ncbi:MAG: hypothetical protein ACQESD_07040 [Thermoplasmatota archaeon]